MVPSACLVPSLVSFPFAAAYIVQSVASVAKIPLLTLCSVDGAPPRAKSKTGPITRLVSTHPRKRVLGTFLIMGFSLCDPQPIAPSTRGTSFVVETSTYFSLPAIFQEAGASDVIYATANGRTIR